MWILVDDRCCCEAKQYDFFFFNTIINSCVELTVVFVP